MDERMQLQNGPRDGFSLERMQQYLPPGTINVIEMSQVPPEVIDHTLTEFEARGAFSEFLLFKGEDHISRYILLEPVVKNSVLTEQNIYVIDVKEGQIVGRGFVRFLSENTSGFPHVGGTYTKKKERGAGLGSTRLAIMNASVRGWVDKPLASDIITETTPSKKEKHVWERLVLEGRAELLDNRWVYKNYWTWSNKKPQ